MKGKSVLLIALSLLLVLGLGGGIGGLWEEARAERPAAPGQAPLLAPLTCAFTYQGRLAEGDTPVTDTCDFKFSLWDAASDGGQISSTLERTASVNNGLFTIPDLNFACEAFPGDARWLAIEVRCPAGSGSYTALTPRQELTATPYALYAKTGGSAGVAWDLSCSVGCVNSVEIEDGTITFADIGQNGCSTNQIMKWSGSAWVCADDETGAGGDFWSLTGNSGTTPGTNFLGTTDDQALELWVNNDRALRLEPNATSPNLIGGYSGNSVISGAYGATIGGGGSSTYPHQVNGSYATIGGGQGNTASAGNATIGGGFVNTADSNATVAGGHSNTASGYYATIGGGRWHNASAEDATVGGGQSNTASGYCATVGGGRSNTASGYYATVGGGDSNTADHEYATIGGGQSNIASAGYGTVGGGVNNTASAGSATVAGGSNNTASNLAATVPGGTGNTASDYYATVGGGRSNTASGYYATVGGGEGNVASAQRATVGGGTYNTGSQYATVGGGSGNEASGILATVPGGGHASATHYGEMAYASGQFTNPGDAQASLYVLRNTSTGSEWTNLYLDGSSARLTIADGRTMTFHILVVGRTSNISSPPGESAGYVILGVIENVGGTLTATWARSEIVDDDGNWDVQCSTDPVNDALLVQVKGNNETIHWVATVRTAEVAW